jgi:biopolymer transport protein ExbD
MPRKVRVPPAPHDDGGGELNVVPFLDIIMNVLMFVLATLAVTFTTRLEVSPPKRDVRGPHADALGLNVAVLHEGFLVSARGQRVGQGCDGPGPGLAVASKAPGDLDYAGLTACVAHLKAHSAGEKDVVITAANDVPYDAIVHTMDAVRGGPGEELFPDVSFGVPR